MPSPAEVSAGGKGLFRYRGGSMWPLFQDGDLLETRRVLTCQLRRGDCIVFRRPEGEASAPDETTNMDSVDAVQMPDAIRSGNGTQRASTIHRIISIEPEIRTQGDARPVQDDDPVAPEWILGRVETRVRCGRSSRVWGGALGRLSAGFYQLAGRVEPSRNSRGGRLARLIRWSMRPVAALCLRQPSMVRFQREDGTMVQYWMAGTRAIAERNAYEATWCVRWPWSLLIDPRSLPDAAQRPSEQPGAPR